MYPVQSRPSYQRVRSSSHHTELLARTRYLRRVLANMDLDMREGREGFGGLYVSRVWGGDGQ